MRTLVFSYTELLLRLEPSTQLIEAALDPLGYSKACTQVIILGAVYGLCAGNSVRDLDQGFSNSNPGYVFWPHSYDNPANQRRGRMKQRDEDGKLKRERERARERGRGEENTRNG